MPTTKLVRVRLRPRGRRPWTGSPDVTGGLHGARPRGPGSPAGIAVFVSTRASSPGLLNLSSPPAQLGGQRSGPGPGDMAPL